jgi:hypothetical protein
MKERSRLMRGIRTLARLAMGGLLALATACGSSPGVQASIGPSGGSLSMENPSVRFDVPAGALPIETMVSLHASADPRSVLVTLEPSQLALAKPGQLSVSLSGTSHISGVAEVTSGGDQPIGVDLRIEDAAGVSAKLGLDHLTRVRVLTADAPDGGTAPGACHDDHDRRHRGEGDGDDGDDDGGHHGEGDGGHHDGEHHDAGVQDDGGVMGDGGVMSSSECPLGFECDDGVCVAHGGNHEHDDDCRGMDAGTCPDDDDDDHDGGHH